jgi:predicted TIM-barrel fold metal-dependent hydrolase
MQIIDTQSHIWESPGTTTRPWDAEGLPTLDDGVSGETQVVAMDAVGVDVLVLNLMAHYRMRQPDGTYRYDNGYADEAVARHPGRLRSVPWIDPEAPDLDAALEEVAAAAGRIAVRAGFRTPESRAALQAGAYDRLFASAARRALPVFLAMRGHPEAVSAVAARNDEATIVVDGLGMPTPPARPQSGDDRYARLPDVVALAAFPNVAIKWAGAPRFSCLPYPFDDLWDDLAPLVAAFGPDRLMFASDWTHSRHHHSYAESVFYLRETTRLSPSDKEQILSGTARRLLPRIQL